MSAQKKNGKITPVEKMELQDVCAYRPKSGGMISSIPCCGRLHDKFCFKLFVFLIVFVLDAADLISDWLLYVDVVGAEEGLVYGPPEDVLRYLLLTFSIIGSLTFTFEIVNLWWEVFRNDPWVDADLLSAITVWIEDVPQITINVFIVACREEAISYFQLVKASVIIIGALIRIIISLIRYCSKKARHDLQCAKVNIESRRHVVYRVFIMLGLFLTLGGAITIFMFTQSERNPDGSLNFKIPHSVVEGEYDDQKYFHNVSIYFSHELFDWNTKVTSAESLNLVRLFKINDIRQEKEDRTIKIQYDQLTGATKIVIWESNTAGTMQAKECFQMDRNNKKVTIGSTCATYIATLGNQFVLKFHYIKPSVPRLIFGDIKYNIKVQDSSSAACKSPDFAINDDINDHSKNRKVAALHYYRTSGNSVETNHVVHSSATDGKFYQSSNLEDIRDVWKTGFAYCKSSGSLAPHQDTSLAVSCS